MVDNDGVDQLAPELPRRILGLHVELTFRPKDEPPLTPVRPVAVSEPEAAPLPVGASTATTPGKRESALRRLAKGARRTPRPETSA